MIERVGEEFERPQKAWSRDATPRIPDMQHAAYRESTWPSAAGIRIAISFAHELANYEHRTRRSLMLGSLENDSDLSRTFAAPTSEAA
jgi:hypothetical protein